MKPHAIRRVAQCLAVMILAVPLGAASCLGQLYSELLGDEPPARPLESSRLAERVGPITDGSWRFAVIGDPEDNRGVFRACLADAKERNCRFVLISGDLVKRSVVPAFQMLRKDLREFGYAERVAAVRGNHDPEWIYRAFFGDSDWACEIGGIRLLGLDNADGPIGAERLEFARSVLRAPNPLPTLVITHVPVFPYRQSRDDADPRDPIERYRTGDAGKETRMQRELIESGTLFALSSHLHAYERETFDGVTQVISGAAGGNPHQTFDGWNYLVVEVVGGVVDVKRVDVRDPPISLGFVMQHAGLSLVQDQPTRPWRMLFVLASSLACAAALWRVAGRAEGRVG